MKALAGGTPYAIGTVVPKGFFRIRCIRFGKLAASYERRPDEQIRKATIEVADTHTRPEKVLG